MSIQFTDSTYRERAKYYFTVFNPLFVFTSKQGLAQAKQTIQRHERGDAIDDWQLRRAHAVVDSAIHPQTQQPIFAPFRLNASPLTSVPIVVGMMTASTPAVGVFWHWVNQSLVVGINISNGNKSNPLPKKRVASAYTTAVAVSCGVYWTMTKSIAKRTCVQPRPWLAPLTAYMAIASAGACNIFATRFHEVREGIDVENEQGEIVGRSKIAGRMAVAQSTCTRVFLPAFSLFGPFVTMQGLEKTRTWKNHPQLHGFRLPIFVAAIAMWTWLGTPMAAALFPEKCSVESRKLEDAFSGMNQTLWFYKGL